MNEALTQSANLQTSINPNSYADHGTCISHGCQLWATASSRPEEVLRALCESSFLGLFKVLIMPWYALDTAHPCPQSFQVHSMEKAATTRFGHSICKGCEGFSGGARGAVCRLMCVD